MVENVIVELLYLLLEFEVQVLFLDLMHDEVFLIFETVSEVVQVEHVFDGVFSQWVQ